MQYIDIILGLAMTASAIDIHLEFNNDCTPDGGGFACRAVNPNQCCGIPSGTVNSITFQAIPSEWYLELRGHERGYCNRLKTLFGGHDKCLNVGSYTGAGYWFRSTKRDVEGGACSLAPESCTSTQMPDVFYLGDGQRYNIANMDERLLEGLAGLSMNVTAATDIPVAFKEFEIKG